MTKWLNEDMIKSGIIFVQILGMLETAGTVEPYQYCFFLYRPNTYDSLIYTLGT